MSIVKGTSGFLNISSGLIPNGTYTVALWFKTVNAAGFESFFYFANTASNAVRIDNWGGTLRHRVEQQFGSGAEEAGGTTANAWLPVIGSLSAGDGVPRIVTDSASVNAGGGTGTYQTPSSPALKIFGRPDNGNQPAVGAKIGMIAIYAAKLGTADEAHLVGGGDPTDLPSETAPTALWLDSVGVAVDGSNNVTSWTDEVGGLVLTPSGTVTLDDADMAPVSYGAPAGPSITAADDITDETQPATVTLANNTAAPTAITINGTAATGITDEGAGVYNYTPPLVADDATATLEVTVDGQTLTSTISYANSYPYKLVTHGTPNANSIFSGTQFATSGPVEWGVVTDYDPAIVIVDHAAMDAAEDELNDVAMHSTEVAAGTTTATYKYFVPESGATGTWQSEITVAAAVVPQGVVTIGTITFDDTTASVPFTYSLSDQTGLEYSLDGGAWTPTTSPVSLSGLTEQTLYSISIRAVNATGSGTAATDTFTTAATPQVPQGVISVGTISLTDISASVEFSYNAADQTGFEYRLGAGSYQAATSPIDIASLTPDTPYTGDIRAINAAGAGTPASFEFTTLATFTPPAPSVPGLGRRGFLRSTVRGTVNSIVGGVSA